MKPASDWVRATVVTALVLYAVSLLGAWSGSRSYPSKQTPAPPSSFRRPDHGPMRGFTINLHHTERFDLYMRSVDELADLGFDSLQVLTPMLQADGGSQTVEVLTGPGRGPTHEQLTTLLLHARRRGLRTALMPVVLFTEPRGNEWRGKIHPEYWDPWWDSYERAVAYFADVAAKTDVSLFCVGSELISTERQPQRWSALIQRTRERFGGQLTYSTTWDHYHVPTVWRHVDMIGISAYWDVASLTDPRDPDPNRLADRWRQIRERILDFAAAQGRPVLFTEVGYPSLPWALTKPWNYINAADIPPDNHHQSLGYQAFLNAWSDLLTGRASDIETPNPVAGVFFYEWDPYHNGGPTDTGYGVRGKPAQRVLRDWLTSVTP